MNVRHRASLEREFGREIVAEAMEDLADCSDAQASRQAQSERVIASQAAKHRDYLPRPFDRLKEKFRAGKPPVPRPSPYWPARGQRGNR
jgi:hypothetical protein